MPPPSGALLLDFYIKKYKDFIDGTNYRNRPWHNKL